MQTPQSFRLSLILRAHEAYEARLQAGENVPHITDDGGLVRFLGQPVAICAACGDNFKLTVPDDLRRFRALVRRRELDRRGRPGELGNTKENGDPAK